MQINGHEFTLGADPEFFIQKDGVPQSAHGLIQGTKTAPTPVDKGAVQVDGMALEYNILPVHTPEQWHDHLTSVRSTLMGMLPGYEVYPRPTVMFEDHIFDAAPVEAKRLGCEPDYNAVTGLANPKPSEDTRMRTAGGHVHVGGFPAKDPFNPQHFTTCRKLVKYMDEQLGVYSVLWDHDDARRQMYGQASCFRPTRHGLEYRTLSNVWVLNPALTDLVYKFTGDAISQMFEDRGEPDPEVYNIINNSDRNSSFFRDNPKADMVMEALEW